MDAGKAPLIFISYSHKDRDVIDLLRDQLRVVALEGYVDPWDDSRIGAGDNWLPFLRNVTCGRCLATWWTPTGSRMRCSFRTRTTVLNFVNFAEFGRIGFSDSSAGRMLTQSSLKP